MVDCSLWGIEKPGRYVGGEVNACNKSFEEASVRFLLAFPDVYEVGMSHLGLRILYHLLNDLDEVMADRAYAPWFDYEARLRESREPLRGLESKKPLSSFDFVGFSLQYELSYTNILTMLDLGRIPIEARERTAEHPFVIAGGPCAFNPEPLAAVFDFVVLGEAEEVLPEIVAVHREWRAAGGTRREFLERVSAVEGVYVPSFFNVITHPSGTVAAVEPLLAGYTGVRKRLITDLDAGSPPPSRPLVPLVDIVHNRLGLEIARGCTRGCRFCQASFIYRPVRERDPAVVQESAYSALSASGFEEVSLLSLSTGDYCRIQPLLASLMDRLAPQRVAVSFPSMRVGTLTPELMELIKRVRKTGFTLAPEAGSERLRRVINKGIRDEDLLETVAWAFQYGWRLLKLYFMIGLPTEEEADTDALVNLCRRVWELAKPSRSAINVAVSTFVPKPLSPFQWAPQWPRALVEQRLGELKERFRRPGLRLKWHHPGQSVLEAVLARGDRRLWPVLRHAWSLGARFDGWTEHFREDLWEESFRRAGIDPAFYAERTRAREEILPWDHLSAGVSRDFLWEEYEKAVRGEFTPDCRWNRCSDCGVCDHREVKPRLFPGEVAMPVEGPEALERGEEHAGFAYRFCYSKLGNIRFVGQLEVAQAFSRAVRRAGLPAAYSKGFHPHVKLSFVGALPLGMESLAEEATLVLAERLDPESVRMRLNACLPEGLHVEHVRLGDSGVSQHTARRRITYQVHDLRSEIAERILAGWKERLREPLVKRTKRGSATAPLGEVLLGLRAVDDSTLEMDLLEESQKCFRPAAVLSLLAGGLAEDWATSRVCKMAVSPFVCSEENEDACGSHRQQ